MPASGARILVVDDNDVNRELLKLRLEVNGFQVELAEGGREALEVLRQRTIIEMMESRAPMEFDLVLLDVMMPEVSGLEVLQHLRRQYTIADLPIIMVTARDQSEDVVEALKLGANDYVIKPIDFPVLFARMETALRLKRLTQQKDEFLAIASHDLKNPLAIVRGFVRMVRTLYPEGSPIDADAIDMLHRAEDQTLTMEQIITDYLDFQAMEDGQLALATEDVFISSIVQKVVTENSTRALEKEIILSLTDVEAELPLLRADPRRMEQVLQNLISNAIKFTKPAGRVHIGARQIDGRILVEVSDTGPGIPKGEEGRLFKKYSRLSTAPTGGEKSSGFGLAICKKIVELHGGEIGATNNSPSPGATFWFSLPVE